MADYYVTLDGNVTKNKKKKPSYTVSLDGTITRNKTEDEEKETVKIGGSTVTRKKQKKEKKKSFFSSGAFEDGYQFGDVTRTIVGTGGDLLTNATKSIFSIGEGIGDTVNYLIAGGADLLGYDTFANNLRTETSKSLTDSIFNPAEEYYDKNSIIGEKGDQVVQALGYVAGNMATGSVAKAGGASNAGATAIVTGQTFTSSFGSGTSEAYQNGATDEEAYLYGLISGTSEAGTELIFGGLGKKLNAAGYSQGLSSADDMLAKYISKNFSNQAVKNVTEYIVKSGAEGLEEVLAGVFQVAGKKLTYKSEEDILKLLEEENLQEQFLIGMMTSGIMQSGTIPGTYQGSLIDTTKNSRDFVTGYTQNEQVIFDKEVENRVAKAEENGKKLTNKEKNKIVGEVKEDFEKGLISTDTIDSVFGGDTYNQLQEKRNRMQEMKTEIDSLLDKKETELTVREARRLKALEEELKTIDTNTLERQLQSEMSQKIEKDDYLKNVYHQKVQRGKTFEYQMSENDSEYKIAVYQSAIDSEANNTVRTHEFADTLVKLSEDRGIQYKFTNNKLLQEQGLIPDGKMANGLYIVEKDGKREILVNLNSKKYLEAILIHETTHDFKTTDINSYTELQNITKEYAKEKGDYNKIYKEISEMYKGVEAVNIDEEVTSRLLEDYLGNKDFINELSTKKQSILKRLLDSIKNFYKRLTAGSPEARKIEQLRQDLEEAYKNAYKRTEVKGNTEARTQYSFMSKKGLKNTIANDPENRVLKSQLNKARIYTWFTKMSNEEIRQKTGWFKDSNGKWLFEIYDKPGKIINSNLQEGHTYKLSEILEHKDLYEAYPELADTNVHIQFYDRNTKGMESIAVYDTDAQEITLNYKTILNASEKEIKRSLLHEAQHKIQQIEGLEQNEFEDRIDGYLLDLGEIEASDVEKRSEYTLKQLKEVAPEVSKKNPIHMTLEAMHKYPKNKTSQEYFKIPEIAKLYDEIYNNGKEGEYNRVKLLKKAIQKEKTSQKKTNKNTLARSENGDKVGTIHNQRRMGDNEKTKQELDNSSFSLKEKQFEIIQENNPAEDDYHTWIRNVSNIKTLQETLQDSDWSEYDEFNPDLTRQDIEDAIAKGSIMVYSSKPIEQGIFVSPSRMEAESYSMDGKVYSKEVNLTDVAWVDPTQGQYAKVSQSKLSLSNEDDIAPISTKKQTSGKDLQIENNVSIQEEITKAIEPLQQSIEELGLLFNNAELETSEDIVPIKEIPKDPTKESSYDELSDLEKKKQREYKKLGSKEDYISNKALELYDEVKGLQKGVKASYELSRVLDVAFANIDELTSNISTQQSKEFKNKIWRKVTTSLLNVKAKPLTTVNEDSIIEAVIRKNINSDYDYKKSQIDNMKEENLVTKTKKELRQQLMGTDEQKAYIIQALDNAKNRSMALMNNTDTIRNTEMVFGREAGKVINEAIFQKEIDNEADSIAWQNKEREDIKSLGIKARSKESAAVQKYGEKQYVNDKGDIITYGDVQLMSEFPDVATQEKIKRAAHMIRNKYDTYIDEANTVLTKLGFDPIKKRPDYMRHFQELTDVFSRYGIPFNAQSMQEHTLPTDINGLTEFWSPQKNYFANMQPRKGIRTTYDAITGIDGYISGISNLIFHTEDIQRGRAFEELIRETYGEDKGWDNLENLPSELQQERADKIQNNHLSNYAAWVHEWTNNIAGKKSKLDRAIEGSFDRKAFSFLDTVRKQVGTNMIGFNLSSSLTNLIGPVQAASKTKKLAVLKGTADTIKNIFIKDNFIEKNKFLTARMGTETLSKNPIQKIQDASFVFMKGMDWFSSNQIVRSKYYELRAKGLSEQDAHTQAGQFAARILGDRTKGANAQLYNSKIFNTVAQFQLEVNNQLYSMFYDTYHESKENAQNSAIKTAAGMTFTLGQLFAFTHLFGQTFEAIAGYNPTFDVIEMLKTAFGWGEEDDEEKTTSERFNLVLEQLLDSLPYVGTFTGGRIPIESALPLEEFFTGKDSYGNEKSRKETLMEALPYYLLPAGYNQAKKTYQGLSMFDEGLPVSGSYTDSGNLRYPVEDTVTNRIQAALFGQYANKNASDYFDNDRQPLKEKQIQEYKDLDMSIGEYWDYREGLKEQKTTADKFNYINDLNVTDDQKNIMINNAINRKEEVDMSNYEDYDSYEEFDYATKNPEKYAVIEQIDSFDKYNEYKEEISNIKETYSNDNGYTSSQRKREVQKYIESLSLDVPQKIMLEKMAGGYSIKDYEDYMFNYIETLNLSAKEKQIIHNQLFS